MLSDVTSLSVYKRTNVLLWMLMAFQAGALNIGGLLACHTFVSHITGFASLAAFEFETTLSLNATLGMLSVPIFFLLGAMFSGALVDMPLQMGRRPKYHILFGLIFLFILLPFYLGISGEFGQFGHPYTFEKDYALVCLLCLACGLQNGSVTSVSRSVIRTTHLTGITTDLGIGIVRVLNRGRIPHKWAEEAQANKMRIAIIGAFAIGSLIGGYFFMRYEYYGFLLPVLTSLTLFSLAAYKRYL